MQSLLTSSSSRGDDQHAGVDVGEPALDALLLQQLSPGTAQLGFERPGRVFGTGMDHAAVVTSLMGGHVARFVQHDYPRWQA